MDWTWRHVATTALALLALLVIVCGIIFAGVRSTDLDRRSRIEHDRACRTVEDPEVRALCLVRR